LFAHKTNKQNNKTNILLMDTSKWEDISLGKDGILKKKVVKEGKGGTPPSNVHARGTVCVCLCLLLLLLSSLFSEQIVI
jgi:hypothetical protein